MMLGDYLIFLVVASKHFRDAQLISCCPHFSLLSSSFWYFIWSTQAFALNLLLLLVAIYSSSDFGFPSSSRPLLQHLLDHTPLLPYPFLPYHAYCLSNLPHPFLPRRKLPLPRHLLRRNLNSLVLCSAWGPWTFSFSKLIALGYKLNAFEISKPTLNRTGLKMTALVLTLLHSPFDLVHHSSFVNDLIGLASLSLRNIYLAYLYGNLDPFDSSSPSSTPCRPYWRLIDFPFWR